MARGCARCGFKEHPTALHFHHLNPAEKEFNIAQNTGLAFSRLKAEIAKCIVLCANCHAIVENSDDE